MKKTETKSLKVATQRPAQPGEGMKRLLEQTELKHVGGGGQVIYGYPAPPPRRARIS